MRARARDPSRRDLAAVRHEPSETSLVFVVDVRDTFLAELARPSRSELFFFLDLSHRYSSYGYYKYYYHYYQSKKD